MLVRLQIGGINMCFMHDTLFFRMFKKNIHIIGESRCLVKWTCTVVLQIIARSNPVTISYHYCSSLLYFIFILIKHVYSTTTVPVCILLTGYREPNASSVEQSSVQAVR